MKNQKSAVIVILITFFLVLFIFWHSKRIREIKPWQRFEKDPQNSCMYCSNSTPNPKNYVNGLFDCTSCKECDALDKSLIFQYSSLIFMYFAIMFLIFPIAKDLYDNVLSIVGNLILFLF